MDTAFEFGDYAIYIWSSYGVTALLLIGFAFVTLRSNAAAKREVEQLRPRRARKEAAAPQEGAR